MSSSRDCSQKQSSFGEVSTHTRKKPTVSKIVTAASGNVSGGSGNAINTFFAEESSFESSSPTALTASANVSSGSPTTLSIFSSMTSSPSRTQQNTQMPPLGSGPSRQRSLRDRLKDGITGSFTWQ